VAQLYTTEISFSAYASRNESDVTPMRWNDAKVSPDGDLWLGSMAITEEAGYGSFYRLDGKTQELKEISYWNWN
jgi:sugar lactone lactonase YvrE